MKKRIGVVELVYHVSASCRAELLERWRARVKVVPTDQLKTFTSTTAVPQPEGKDLASVASVLFSVPDSSLSYPVVP
jgi:hypothetical protein